MEINKLYKNENLKVSESLFYWKFETSKGFTIVATELWKQKKDKNDMISSKVD